MRFNPRFYIIGLVFLIFDIETVFIFPWAVILKGAGPFVLVEMVIFLAILVYTWPNPPWTPLLYGGIALMIVLPALFYPFSKTLFLAFDLVFRPPTATDFE